MSAVGSIVSINIAEEAAGPMRSISEVRAVPGKGLEGDRYFQHAGTWSDLPGSGREVTLIESEAIEALAREEGISIEPGQARRNLVTRGVAVNHLVGVEFSVGAVRLRGMRLAEPCGHLEKLTAHGVRSGLVHRGGLRAKILTEGIIRVGDPVGA